MTLLHHPSVYETVAGIHLAVERSMLVHAGLVIEMSLEFPASKAVRLAYTLLGSFPAKKKRSCLKVNNSSSNVVIDCYM